jgi:hypothetical protein
MSPAEKVDFVDRKGPKIEETNEKDQKIAWQCQSFLPCRSGTGRQNNRQLIG